MGEPDHQTIPRPRPAGDPVIAFLERRDCERITRKVGQLREDEDYDAWWGRVLPGLLQAPVGLPGRGRAGSGLSRVDDLPLDRAGWHYRWLPMSGDWEWQSGAATKVLGQVPELGSQTAPKAALETTQGPDPLSGSGP